MIIPAGIIEAPFRRIILNPPSLGALLLTSIFAVGFVEEYLKYWVVRRLVYSHDEFNEPVDGVVYALTAGLGFAAFENVLYTMSYGLSVGITRGVVTSIVHASFSGIIGFAMGTAKFAPESVREITIWRSIVTASVLAWPVRLPADHRDDELPVAGGRGAVPVFRDPQPDREGASDVALRQARVALGSSLFVQG